MLLLFFLIVGFNKRIAILSQLNVIIALLITRSYWFSWDLRIFTISLTLFLVIIQILPKRKLHTNVRGVSSGELIILGIWTWLVYYFYGYSHSEDMILGIYFNIIYLLKWYTYWIVYRAMLSRDLLKSIFSAMILLFSVITPLMFDGRTDIFLLLLLICMSFIKNEKKRVRMYLPQLAVFGIIFMSFSIYTATRNMARYNENLTVQKVLETSSKQELVDIVSTYTWDRMLETSEGAEKILSKPPKYLATFSNLPQVLIPRFLNPDKGFFLPGLYYEELLGGYRAKIGDKNREVGFIGIWWHNFGYFSLVYFVLLIPVILLIGKLESMFLIFWIPKLFGDYNSIPVLLIMIIFYQIINMFYVSYSRN